jgi:amidase
MSDVHFQTITELSESFRRGELTSSAVTRRMLDRIARLDPTYRSYAHVCHDRALEQAERADREIAAGISRGPLHGVPIAVKDLCYTRYAPTAAGTTLHAGFVPPYDATVVERLELAGAVVLGKLSMTEGAYASHHPEIPAPLNPWNRDAWAGASSSGSGVATAAGLCFGSLGSDTGGSIRLPSAMNGLTGIKPTWGRVSRYGVFPLAETMDHIGPMTRSAADGAVMLQAIAGWDPHDPTSIDAAVPDYVAEVGRSVRDLRIGIDRRYASTGTDAEVSSALEAAIEVFSALGARFVDVTFPPFEALVASWNTMCAVETALAHEATYPAKAELYGPALRGLIEVGRSATGVEIARGHLLRVRFTEALATLFRRIDCLLIPTIPMRGPSVARIAKIGEDADLLAGIIRFTSPFDLSGTPTITLPCGFDSTGLPITMQLAGPRLGEAVLIRAGHAYQTQTDWHRRHPVSDAVAG